MKKENLYYDFHIHSCYSFDSDLKPEDIIRKAQEKSLKEIAITDHCFSLEDLEGLENRTQHLNQLKKENAGLLNGIELSIEESFIMETLKNGIFDPLDLVIAGIHGFKPFGLYPNFEENGVCSGSFADICKNVGLDVLMNYYFETFNAAIETGNVDVVAHPFDLFYFAGYLNDHLINSAAATCWLDKCAKYNVRIELNASLLAGWKVKGRGKEGKEGLQKFYIKFVDKCKKQNISFSVGSDAHYLDNIGELESLNYLLKEIEFESTKVK